jgi:hypothetical protein
MGEKKKKEEEEYALVAVCQKVPCLSLTLDGLCFKITIEFSGAGELDEQGEVIVFLLLIIIYFSPIHSFYRSGGRRSRGDKASRWKRCRWKEEKKKLVLGLRSLSSVLFIFLRSNATIFFFFFPPILPER